MVERPFCSHVHPFFYALSPFILIGRMGDTWALWANNDSQASKNKKKKQKQEHVCIESISTA